ncbi:MAG: S1-like domain-containing RNA-binding protein [Fuerstiella sp.]
MIQIGQTYQLSVLKKSEFGFFLDAENLGEILLPTRNAPAVLNIDDSVEVFLYVDSEDRPIATTQVPKAEVGEFAYLEVKENTRIGAFLDWGLDKDVLLPFAEQHRKLHVGQSYLVFLYLDDKDRITATSKIDKIVMENDQHNFQPQQEVDLIIGNSTDLGYKAIVDNSHWGLLYKNEVTERLSFGQSILGFIKHIRPDGRIDLSLKSSRDIRDGYTETIQAYLDEHDGFAPVHDKSAPAEIFDLLGMSKGQFKKAIGGLYKRHIITIEKEGIRRVSDD